MSRSRDESGNIIVAVLIILVVCTLGSVMAFRTIGNTQTVLSRQQTDAALSEADAGLADALFRLDQGTSGTGSGFYFCVNANDSNCVAGSVPAAPGVSYVANKVSATKWTVDSIAKVDGKDAAVQEEVTRSPVYPFAVFGQSALTFNGTATMSGYDPTEPLSATNPNPNASVAVGSNGTITCNGSIGSNVQVVYYGTGGVGSTQDANCGAYQKYTNKYYLATPTAPSDAQACPDSGTIGAPGVITTLAAGTYLCTTPIHLSGIIEMGGPVQLYVILDQSVYGPGSAAVTIDPGSYINDQADYCANGGTVDCSPTPNLPEARNFEVFSNATGYFGDVVGQNGYYFGGVVDAPLASLTEDGCDAHYYGALDINTLTCNGGPHLSVSYEEVFQTYYGAWTPAGYTQVNPSSVSIP